MTILANNSSVNVNVTADTTITIDGSLGARAIIEAVSGVPGASTSRKIAVHRGGVATYGPFGVGVVRITAVSGDIDYLINSSSVAKAGPLIVSAVESTNSVSSKQFAAMKAAAPSEWDSPGSLITDWTNGTISLVSSNGGGEAIALDPSVTCDGASMIKATVGSSGTYIADFLLTAPVYLAQMQSLQIPIRVSQNNAVFGGTGPAQIWLWDDSTGTRQWRLATSLNAGLLRPGKTHILSFGPGASSAGWAFGGSSAPTNTTDLDAYSIYRIRIVIATPASVAGEAVWFGPIRANSRRTPVVSIVLDGQYASQHNYLLPMIEAQGLKCSLALQHSLIGSGGRMSEAQIARAYAAGHELIHHTYDGSKTDGYQASADWADAAAITADILAGHAYQQARGWTRGIGYAVHGGATHPYSGAVTAARQSIVTAGYRGAGIKAIRSGNGSGAGVLAKCQSMSRVSEVDPYCVQGTMQWTSTDDSSALIAPITRAKARGEWSIYTGHRSVVSSPGSLEILNSDALTWLQSLGDDVRAGKVIVLPFGAASEYYGLTGA